MECLSTCHLNNGNVRFDDLRDRANNNTVIRTLDAQQDDLHYRLEYSPVGNEIQNPVIILSGITAAYDSWQLYLNAIRNGVPT